jgi:hypothetical protein
MTYSIAVRNDDGDFETVDTFASLETALEAARLIDAAGRVWKLERI